MAATSRHAVRIGDADCFFRVDEKARYRAGETALLVLNPGAYLFDKASDRSLL
jgi:hypothetical protein